MVSGVAQLLRDHVWKLHGLLEEVIHDRGTQSMSNFTCSLSQLLRIKIAASTAYCPQTDDQTKRLNQEIKQFLWLFVKQNQDDWYKWLAMAEFSYNDQIHTLTHSSPFMLDTEQNLQLGGAAEGILAGNYKNPHFQHECSDDRSLLSSHPSS